MSNLVCMIEQMLDKNGKKLNLLDIVKDDITGCKGALVSVTLWSNGCIRIGVQPRELKDGIPVKISTIDLEDIVSLEKTKKRKIAASRTGGPKPDPVKR